MTCRRFGLFFLFATFAFGQIIPGRYIVELNEPAAAKTATGVVDARAAQAPMRARLAAMGADVRDSLAATTNALIIDAPEGAMSRIRALGEVKRITAVRRAHISMDATPSLLAADNAWRNAGGADKAGLGIKIGIIDTGIDQTHPEFQDLTLRPVTGYPKVSQFTDLAFTNSKVIVARSYVSMYSATAADKTPRDYVGHGTSVAMAAAGILTSSPRGPVSGMAPKAFLGNYRASGPGAADYFDGDVVLKAFDDAVADGMDVINLSLGSSLALRPEDDIFTDMVNAAAAKGVVVVAAAGNAGPDAMTMSDFAQPPLVIAVGATQHGRTLSSTMSIPGLGVIMALLGSNTPDSTPALTAPIIDVATLDPTGLACGTLPAGRLAGAIALIMRGGGTTCPFELKIQNAAAAGARGVVIYLTPDDPTPFPWDMRGATLPSVMISSADGLRLKGLIAASPLSVTINFALMSVPTDNTHKLATFSSTGPGTGFAIKPDLVSIGTDVYMAAPGNTFRALSGTSFSAPIVAGTVAFLKSARPNLTVEQYRSLVINSAIWMDPRLQQRGNGSLHVDMAANSAITSAPATVSFGISGINADASRQFTITNMGRAIETFSITVFPLSAGPAPTVDTEQVTLEVGQSKTINTLFRAQGLPGGERNGLFIVRGGASGAQIYVPYWHGVPNNTPAQVSVLYSDESAQPGKSGFVYFRLLDFAGMAAIGPVPTLRANAASAAAGASVVDVTSLDFLSPGLWEAEVHMRTTAGTSTYTIHADGAPDRDVTILAAP